MRILITGGAGLIGSHCAEYFARKKARVIVLDNLIRSKIFGSNKDTVEYNWRYLRKFKNIELIIGDVRSEKDVSRAVGKGVDAVIHAAGQPGFPASLRMPIEDFDINGFGTLNVLDYLRRKCRKAVFIYCSSNKIYGKNINKIPIKKIKGRYMFRDITGVDERLSVDMTGHTPYGVSKLVGDLYAQEYAYSYGMRTGVFRMGCVYGPRQFGFEEQGWEAWFTIACLCKKKITIYGDGAQVRDILYADDAVRAYDSFLQSGFSHRVYNIGGGIESSVSLLEFLSILQEEIGNKPRVCFAPWRQGDQKVYMTDYSLARKQLRWQPRMKMRVGITAVIEWVKQNRDLFV
ncbi:MAG: NAD-dependent epimerase/dehydratase family protein [Candidatus Omnitrophica bacterium]|nr:NAD-dependent epimerase/dehydratase family protein [Candidatus Omnitrophota bacterium]